MKKANPVVAGLLLPGALAALLFALVAGISFVGCWETEVKGTVGTPCKEDAGCRSGMVCKACGCMPEGVECPTDANEEGGDAPSEGGDAPADAPSDSPPADTTDSAPDTTDTAVAPDVSDAPTDG